MYGVLYTAVPSTVVLRACVSTLLSLLFFLTVGMAATPGYGLKAYPSTSYLCRTLLFLSFSGGHGSHPLVFSNYCVPAHLVVFVSIVLSFILFFSQAVGKAVTPCPLPTLSQVDGLTTKLCKTCTPPPPPYFLRRPPFPPQVRALGQDQISSVYHVSPLLPPPQNQHFLITSPPPP